MKRKFIAISIGLGVSLVFLCVYHVAAQATAGQAGAYLKLGMDARALGMGSAYSAVSDDVSAVYWNPAGLAFINRQQVMATYTAFPESGNYSQIAYALPIKSFAFPSDNLSGSTDRLSLGTLGLIILRYVAAYNIEARQIDSLNPDYLFADIEGCYGLSYGIEVYDTVCMGLGVKGFYHQLDQANANGWGIDAGVTWLGFPGLSVALAIRGLYSQLEWSTGFHEVFPAVLTAGIAYQQTFFELHTLLLSTDITYNLTSAPRHIYAGLEYGFHQMFFLRLGYDDGKVTVGGGVRILWIGWGRAGLRLDYAACEDRIVDWNHWFTLKLEL